MDGFIFLDEYAFRKRHGIITCYGTWQHNDDEAMPCLALVRTGDEGKPMCTPHVIMMNEIALWNRETDAKLPYEVSTKHALAAAISLRLNSESKTVLVKIISVINDHIGDLLAMRPYVQMQGDIIGEIALSDGSKTVTTEIRENVRGY